MNTAKVVILLATCNGEAFLAKQLESIIAQTYTNWELWVSDDASTDATLDILNAYQSRLGPEVMTILSGPTKGFAANFLSLICNEHIHASYYAYCDQDDVWQGNKLAQAVLRLKTIPADKPALYCSRTQLIDEHGHSLGHSKVFKKSPGFLNALVQNIAGGNTMIINQASMDLLRQAGRDVAIVAHDWWTYLLVTGANGVVFYDTNPSVQYRQHPGNVIGSNSSLYSRYIRFCMLLKGRFRLWNDINTHALVANLGLLAEENQKILQQFIKTRSSSLIPRLIQTKLVGIYRQTFLGNLGLALATLLKKM